MNNAIAEDEAAGLARACSWVRELLHLSGCTWELRALHCITEHRWAGKGSMGWCWQRVSMESNDRKIASSLDRCWR